MSTISRKPSFCGRAARVVMAGTLALAFAPALPAFADEAAPAASAETAQVTTWKDFYKKLGIDTSTGYDAVTSATQFTGHHVKDIPSVVHKTANAEGATTGLDGFDATAATAQQTVQVKLQKAEYEYAPQSTHGTGTFLLYPDDTVPGYTWNEYLGNTYAATVSDGTTTVGAVPWVDYYGENSTSGYHYNKMEIALNNGTSVASNGANVTRFAKFYDANGNVKAGTYTVTVYSKGYTPLIATVKVLPTYAGAQASASSKASSRLQLTGLPSDLKDGKVTVSYTTGRGRNAVTTYLAGGKDDGVAAPNDGIVTLNAEELAKVENRTKLSVVIANSTYAPISLSSEVADTASFQNGLAVKASTKTVKAKKLKKKAQAVSALKVTNPAGGKLSYKKASGSKKLALNAKNGKVTVKKGTKKGTYKAKVRVQAAANGEFAAAAKTVTVKVKVK